MTDYHIHPRTGDDQDDGLTPQTPWKGFGPLATLHLGPGDRVRVLEPGALDQTILLRGAGTASQPIHVQLAPGRYDLFPAHLTTRRYHISNCNDQPDGNKALAMFIDQARHVRIEGHGAKLICRGKMIELCIDQSESIHIAGLTFDYHRPTVSEWTVTATTDHTAELTVHSDSTYRIQDGKITWIGEGWEYDTGLAQQLIPETHEVWRRKDPLASMRMEEIAPHRLRAIGEHDMAAGHVFQLRNPFRDYCGVLFNQSKDITLEDVHFAFMHGMGVMGQFTQDITLRRVRIAPDPDSGRTTAAWADCTHFSGCRGTVVIEDCRFEGAHDDAANVHGIYLRIIDQPGPNQIKVAFIHRQTYGLQAFFRGDEIEFTRAATLEPFGAACVTTLQMLNPHELLLTLDRPAPPWNENDVVENVTWTPRVRVTGCTALRIPTRGFLLTTRRPILVAANTFIALQHGIHISSDTQNWFESGCVRDLTISHNRFLNSKRAAIRIEPENTQPNASLHRHISIHDNHFRLVGDRAALQAKSVTALHFTNNQLVCESPGDVNSRLGFEDCKQVLVQANRVVPADH